MTVLLFLFQYDLIKSRHSSNLKAMHEKQKFVYNRARSVARARAIALSNLLKATTYSILKQEKGKEKKREKERRNREITN